jgi:hypothetical protein
MNIMKKLCAVLALTFVATGCGTQFGGNYSGTWQGSLNSVQITNTTFTMTLYQTGNTVSGFWLAVGSGTQPLSGSFQGTVSGSTLQATLIAPTNSPQNFAGTYTGTLTLTNTTLTGSLAGTATVGGSLSATITLSQQR